MDLPHQWKQQKLRTGEIFQFYSIPTLSSSLQFNKQHSPALGFSQYSGMRGTTAHTPLHHTVIKAIAKTSTMIIHRFCLSNYIGVLFLWCIYVVLVYVIDQLSQHVSSHCRLPCNKSQMTFMKPRFNPKAITMQTMVTRCRQYPHLMSC